MPDFIIRTEPIAKARARTVVKFGRVMSFTPKKTTDAENAIREQIMNSNVSYGKAVPLRVDLLFIISRPHSVSKKRAYPITRPDIDNYIKLVLDACNHYLWQDDSQIVDLSARKVYVDGDSLKEPLIQIHIESMQ